MTSRGRAPKGFRTMPDGTWVRKVVAADYEICLYSNRRVTETQRRRKLRDCPLCGAPDVEWYSQLHPDILFWQKHRKGEGRGGQLDIWESPQESLESSADDVAPF